MTTVLVADDDAAVRTTMAEYLGGHGYEVAEAAHGLETLLLVKRLRPPIIVLDIGMPRLDGIEALKRIHAFSPEATVVIATAVIDPAVHRRAMELGARGVLVKPFALPDLLAAIGGPIEPISDLTGEGAESPARAAAEHLATVLIVDDEPDIRETLSDLLRPEGFAVHTAVDGAAALRVVLERKPDLVLLDIDMPRLRGVEALVAIRELSPATRVIMMSGKADLDEARRSLASGAFDYVTKPFDFAYLDRAIRTAVLGAA